ADNNGTTPLLKAVQKGHVEVVRLLLAKNAKVTERVVKHLPEVNRSCRIAIETHINQLELLNYIERTQQHSDDSYLNSMNLFGPTLNVGYSAKEKKEAALALKRVMIDG